MSYQELLETEINRDKLFKEMEQWHENNLIPKILFRK